MGVAGTGTVVLDPSIRLVVARSERYMNTARTALATGDPESAASRAYYALYHMTILLLRVVRGIERDRWDHDQLQKAFLDEFCKLHFRFSRDDGREWGDVMDTRFTADYGRVPLNHRRAQRSVERAERLIAKMRREVAGDA
jgi:uncharacterized protein (UPF0332 family)